MFILRVKISFYFYFKKDSTRTRCAFEVAARSWLSNNLSRTNRIANGEKKKVLKIRLRVLGGMFDAIEFRGYLQADIEILAQYSGVPVYSGLTDQFHPTQILADFLTIQEKIWLSKRYKICILWRC